MEGGLSRAGMDVRDWRPALPSPSTAGTARRGGQAKATVGGGRTGTVPPVGRSLAVVED